MENYSVWALRFRDGDTYAITRILIDGQAPLERHLYFFNMGYCLEMKCIKSNISKDSAERILDKDRLMSTGSEIIVNLSDFYAKNK